MSKHTPGPWTVTHEDDFDGLVIEAAGREGEYVPVACVPVDYDDRLEREANAALIVRAPEMAAEIERLNAEVERLKAVEADYDDHEREMIDLEEENSRLTARVEELEVEVEAAKKFGGGFYGEAVEEGTREVYRGFARAAITQEKREG